MDVGTEGQWPTHELEQALEHRYNELGGDLAPRDREFKAIRRARRILKGSEEGRRGLQSIHKALAKLEKGGSDATSPEVFDAALALLSNLRVSIVDRLDSLKQRVDALPPAATLQDFADKRSRWIVQLERSEFERESGSLRWVARRMFSVYSKLGPIELRVASAEKASLPYTDPGKPFDGRGVVSICVGEGPWQTLHDGTAGMHIFSPTNRGVSFGSSARTKPWIEFSHDGKFFKGRGKYPVAEHPLVWDDDFKRDFANGYFQAADGTFYTFTSGTLWITKLSTKKRILSGLFDVIGESDSGATTRVKGTFALCDFGIEFRDRISLAE